MMIAKISLHRIFKGIVITSLQIWIILIDKLSYPWAVLGSNDFNIDSISFSEILKDFILEYILYEENEKAFPLFIGVHIDTKKLLKKFPFSKQSETNFPSTSNGGIPGIFLL